MWPELRSAGLVMRVRSLRHSLSAGAVYSTFDVPAVARVAPCFLYTNVKLLPQSAEAYTARVSGEPVKNLCARSKVMATESAPEKSMAGRRISSIRPLVLSQLLMNNERRLLRPG